MNNLDLVISRKMLDYMSDFEARRADVRAWEESNETGISAIPWQIKWLKDLRAMVDQARQVIIVARGATADIAVTYPGDDPTVEKSLKMCENLDKTGFVLSMSQINYLEVEMDFLVNERYPEYDPGGDSRIYQAHAALSRKEREQYEGFDLKCFNNDVEVMDHHLRMIFACLRAATERIRKLEADAEYWSERD